MSSNYKFLKENYATKKEKNTEVAILDGKTIATMADFIPKSPSNCICLPISVKIWMLCSIASAIFHGSMPIMCTLY